MASSNPFRRSVAQPRAADSALPHLDPIDTTETYAAPPRTSFRDAEPSDADEEPVPEPERKKKPVKKVRVLTPPPLSPDSSEWPDAEPMYRTGAGLAPPPAAYDPFAGSATDESDRDSTATPPFPKVAAVALASAPPQAPTGPPGNPFSRTLHDMETAPSKEELDLQQKEEGEALKAANAGTPTLNVDAFRRLLLTGKSGIQGSEASADDQALASYNAQANKIVPALDGAQDESQTNNNIQLDQQAVSPSIKDKKLAPPPPSSRHGKTIRGGQPRPTRSESERQSMSPETEFTLHSRTPSGNGIEFISDEGSSADSHTNEAAAPSGTKKAAPAPPPRRGHARTDTKSNLPSAPPLKPNEDDYEPRSSTDSTHRQERAQIPAPPPPRRPHATPKQSGAVAAPSPAVSSSSIPQRGQVEAASPSPSSKTGKSPAPPRPPSRNPSSARRLPGGGGGGSASSAEKRDSLPPPPPPRRSRGSSSPTRKSSSEMADAASVDPSKGADILADLDALRREVEALRGAR
ncbi:hypothetical protein ISF_03904 [Cordyceps fumosorosea ARSEF 2679]|uniref:Uncharacterized protein n=1 Tax=Cordyceps fumosorosea (strain ARSEF 2679) TaxID=1081104 RepID=A0A167YAH5_CORFA|nr:hypothetical protein ISF_03904 [Cordyceps fumosorosea ARSEF 2679]OAA66066.1 hypothetical protein ISF_03904 [Cordyceps fumosorosea ARSEF 2679]